MAQRLEGGRKRGVDEDVSHGAECSAEPTTTITSRQTETSMDACGDTSPHCQTQHRTSHTAVDVGFSVSCLDSDSGTCPPHCSKVWFMPRTGNRAGRMRMTLSCLLDDVLIRPERRGVRGVVELSLSCSMHGRAECTEEDRVPATACVACKRDVLFVRETEQI